MNSNGEVSEMIQRQQIAIDVMRQRIIELELELCNARIAMQTYAHSVQQDLPSAPAEEREHASDDA